MNEELKYCKFCDEQKPIKDFCKSGGFIKNICRECHNKKQKERYANSKLVEEKNKEIERLNNIINELEKIWKEEQKYYLYRKDNRYRAFLSKNLDRLKELKEDMFYLLEGVK